ncbi:B-box zinc finger family protein [Tritrichomonas foetus]|uniref:B-box zinc finger family protein n=1 Tax=Tritrichomonas foetus TaxID=1144522 RepID=A0A1J4J6K7_9EUKA|nr:B-box zinc finger family protein [Tritrichomonas foetus]|eukprot:OHS93291.1 B-box zinc finger family protein [Tritrichomonas foetus]
MNDISMSTLIKQFSTDLICFVCHRRSVNPKIMPCCGNIGCENCLNHLIHDGENRNCLICHKEINRADQPVHLHLIDSMIEILPFLTHAFTETNICNRHEKQIEFYCIECQTSLCAECIFDELYSNDSKHKNHHIKKASDMLGDLKKKLQQDITAIGSILETIETRANTILDHESKLNQARNSFLLELHTTFREMLVKIENKKEKAKEPIDKKLNELNEMRKYVVKLISNLDHLINTRNPLLITETPKIVKKTNKIYNQLQNIGTNAPSINVENDLLPQYQFARIEIPNFQETQLKFAQLDENDIRYMFSAHRIIAGNKWRAKIYPNGNQNGIGTHISVFVELLSGYKEASEYFYRVEIESHSPKKRNIVKEYKSKFGLNDSWGWNKVALLETIYEPGYLDENGSLTLLLGIKAGSYYQTFRDLQYSVQAMKIKIKDLKKKHHSKQTAKISKND